MGRREKGEDTEGLRTRSGVGVLVMNSRIQRGEPVGLGWLRKVSWGWGDG